MLESSFVACALNKKCAIDHQEDILQTLQDQVTTTMWHQSNVLTKHYTPTIGLKIWKDFIAFDIVQIILSSTNVVYHDSGNYRDDEWSVWSI